LVSIGLPVFNGEAYLREAIDSVLAQDFTDFELVVCDNASTDGTASIVAEYVARDGRVRYVPSDENRGAAWNYNRCVDLARGRWFRWMPADDRIDPSCLRRCLEVYQGGARGVVCVYPKTRLIDADGNPDGEYEDRAACDSDRAHLRVRTLLRNLVLCNAVLGLVPLEVLRDTRRIGPWRASDHTLLVELALRGRIVEVPERLFARRRDARLPSPSNMTPEERARWFAAKKASPLFRTRLIRETFRAVSLSPLGLGARMRCHATVLRDAVRYRWRLLREWRDALRWWLAGAGRGAPAELKAPAERSSTPR